MPSERIEPLFKTAVVVLLLIAGCTASASPTTTEPAPRWCPHTDPASGQRYFLICEP